MPRYVLRALASGVATALAVTVAATSGTAVAAPRPAVTHLRATAAPVTVKVRGRVTVTGTATPRSTASVVLQRRDGKRWVSVGHSKPTTTGAYALAVRAPAKPATLTLRVVRAASGSAKAGVGRTLHVRVVRSAFAVTAAAPHAVSTSAPLTVTGTVSPKGTGRVSLDRLVKGRWTPLARATLTRTSTYGLTTTLAAGSYTLRVSKALTTKVAAGVSKSFTVVATAPPPAPPPPPAVDDPVVTTTSLPAMTAGRALSTTLTATHGVGPYSWAVVSGALPSGLLLLPDGSVSGAPVAVGLTSVTVRVTDARGHSGTGEVSAAVGPVVVRAWGDNSLGELGNGTTTSNDAHTTVTLPGTVRTISVGQHYALALLTDGTVYAWGDGSDGTLGQGDTASHPTPIKVPTLAGVVSIAAGYSSAYAVTSAGTVYAWGRNYAGELADGTHSSDTTDSPQLVTSLSNVVSVAAGNEFALALLGNGSVRSWGYGTYGTLGDGTTDPQQTTPVTVLGVSGAVQLAATGTAAYALRSDGTVKAWGLKEHGQLGTTTFPDGGPYEPRPQSVMGLTDATDLSCHGFELCLARRADGTVSVWGYGYYGATGNGPANADALTSVSVPGLAGVVGVATSNTAAYAVRADGSVLSWGDNLRGQLGNGDTTHTATSSPAVIPGLAGAFAVAAGGDGAFALRAG